MDRASPTGFQRASCIAWWWGGWDSNPRPRDDEVSQGPSLTCMIIGDLLSDLRFHRWRPPGRRWSETALLWARCGHGVGTVWARCGHGRYAYRARVPWLTHLGRSGRV